MSEILEQTETLAILSVPDRCKPHFYPSSEFNWISVLEGMSEGGGGAIEELQYCEMENGTWESFLSGFIVIPLILRVPVDVFVGGTSNSCQMPNAYENHFRAALWIAFEDPDLADQVGQRIHTNCREKKLDSQWVYWSDRQCAEYRSASSRDKKVKMKEFCRTLDLSGNQMLLKIHGIDYGLVGGTMDDPVSCFFMNVQAELIRSKDGKRIYRREFEYKSVSYELKEWEANRGQALKEEFDQACQNIGDLISNDLFGPKDELRS
jgi:hypothetical protein